MLFKIDDEEWTLDLRIGKGKVSKGGPGSDKPDLTLTISDDNFVKLVMGKLGPQQVPKAYCAVFTASVVGTTGCSKNVQAMAISRHTSLFVAACTY